MEPSERDLVLRAVSSTRHAISYPVHVAPGPDPVDGCRYRTTAEQRNPAVLFDLAAGCSILTRADRMWPVPALDLISWTHRRGCRYPPEREERHQCGQLCPVPVIQHGLRAVSVEHASHVGTYAS